MLPQRERGVVESVKTHPAIAAAILERRQAAAGRVWLLLRAHDTAGRGWLDVDQVYQLLTAENSNWRLFKTRRRVQQILLQGEGVFWTRFTTRIGLRSAAKVAAALGVTCLVGEPVNVPTGDLIKSLQSAKAALFAAAASAHTTRRGRVRLVTRRVLKQRTGASERTQRRYSLAAGIYQQSHIGKIPIGDGETLEEAWQRAHYEYGRGVFIIKDYRGYFGKQGQTQLVRRLPDSHHVPYARARRGRKSKINQALNNLVELVARPKTAAMRGNCEQPVYNRTFYDSPASAGAEYNRDCRTDHYWQQNTTANGIGVWLMLPAQRRGYGNR